MTHAQELLATHPRSSTVDAAALVACIEACFDCAQSCVACDVCAATGRVFSRVTEFDPQPARAVVAACAEACKSCAEECERHAHHHEHCRICAELCRRCEKACRDVLSALTA